MKHTFPWILSLLAACGGAAPDLPLDEASPAEIMGGRRDTRHLSVGQVGSLTDDGVAWFCTGTLVAPRSVLTAAHCLFDASGRRLTAAELLFGLDDEFLGVVGARTYRYAPGSADGWNDLALLTLEHDAEQTPTPIATAPPRAGGTATVVGYGVTRATGPQRGVGGGVRRSVAIIVNEVRDSELAYDSSTRGACYGDSGGPVLVGRGAAQRVAGVTSRGTALDCRGIDIATRVDAYRSWLLPLLR